MRKLTWKIVLVTGLLALCLWSLFPLEKKIRLGRDLRGGVSLIYHVRIDPDDPNPQATIAQVITVLMDRVNPSGVLDISMHPMGADRIEVVMPLPDKFVIALRVKYEQALDALLREAHISPSALQRGLESRSAVGRFGGAGGGRLTQIESLQESYDTLQSAWDALESARDAGADEATLGPLEQAVADGEIAFDDGREAVLRLSLGRARVERTLRLSVTQTDVMDTTGQPLLDPDTGERQRGPSPREIELGSIDEEFPFLADALARLVVDYNAYAEKRRGFDDPEDLMRLLRGAGLLEYRIAVRDTNPQGVNPVALRAELAERGPRETQSSVGAWFPVNDLKQWYKEPEDLARLQADPVAYFAGQQNLVAAERDGVYYLLLYITPDKSMTHEGDSDWAIIRTYAAIDNFGRNAIGFGLDGPGGRRMNRLTGPNVGEPMAILLDGQVYSAPIINQPISENGIIQGNFSKAEINYLTRVLAAGSLEAKLSSEPIAMNTLGPSIGADNLRRGMTAFKISVIAVAIFMFGYYFFAGIVADMALLANGIIIFGMMSMIEGTFTLPGLAGIVLTIGMAVDANVLIYERVREEIRKGEELRASIRVGYAKALSTILDANITNLIVCFVLFKTATTEVKGFALTLSIGICGTLFTTLFVTRIIYEVYTDVLKARRLPMLPTVVPAIHRLLSPNVDWISLRTVFWSGSGVVVLVSIMLISARGVDMFDTEFRGGVSATMRTAIIEQNGDDEPLRLMLEHEVVQASVYALSGILDRPDSETARRLLAALRAAGVIARDGGDEDLAETRSILAEMANASVLTVGDTEIRDGSLYASSFQVKVASPKDFGSESTTMGVVVAAIIAEFGDRLDVTQPLSFLGAGSDQHAPHTFPITRDGLGENIQRPRFVDKVTEFIGGVAVVVEEIDPPVDVDDVVKRIGRMRAQPDFKDYVGRDVTVIGLDAADPADPSAGYSSVAILVYDPELSFFDVDFDLWDREVAKAEWLLASEGLERQTSMESVSSYSPAVAETLSAKATVSVVLSLLGILVYIWIRFGSLRYSAAAIIALLHDVCVAMGMLAASAWIASTAVGSFLLVEDFRIDLGVVAAMLTIIGYSLNDTIVILDRIRENRGKLPIPTADIVNRSINQTISRTVLTSVTTLLAVSIMYGAGGGGIRSFSYTLLIGLVVGTYSSVAIAAPLVVRAATGRKGLTVDDNDAATQDQAGTAQA